MLAVANPDCQRRGLARAMVAAARAVEPTLHHSADMTADGEAWRSAVWDI